jgi:NAD(P)-dependent dehydrogenase (short-subunit alcohol dehydrogenase family)
LIKLKPIASQVIVITGASSGIGRETALLAATRGATVVLAARGERALHALAEAIEGDGGKALAVVCDVSDAAAVKALARRAIGAFGRIDCWINNAGVAIASPLKTLPEADARRLFDVNFWGVVDGSLAALPYLERQGGALINLGSFTSDVSAPFMGMYWASKTKSLIVLPRRSSQASKVFRAGSTNSN